MFSINEFKSRLTGGGARNSLFRVIITNPITGAADLKAPFMIKAASLPGATVGSFEIPYMGRKIKMGGDRTYEDWTITVINDEDFLIRNAMEAWNNAINTHQSNLRALPAQYKSQALITQLGKDKSELRTYIFDGIFPTQIAPIEMAWESTDQIEDFQVTFSYDEYRVAGKTGNPNT